MSEQRMSNVLDLASDLRGLIRDIPDFPTPGIVFKDITPLLGNGPAFRRTIEAMALPFVDARVDQVVAMEARGFILGAPIAALLGAGFVPVRKGGKLPSATERIEYALEYGTGSLEIHADAYGRPSRVLIVDDVLATGGTAAATAQLVERLGGEIVGCAFLMELTFLKGRAPLAGRQISALLTY
jgi:adenine phosphoribosyltransferase